MSASKVIRWAGLSAVVAGVLFLVVVIIHPPNDGDPAPVATSSFAIAHYFALGYSVFGLLGISGIYARQVEEAGWFGLVAFLTFYVALAIFTAFNFFEGLILPLLATEAPQFVEAFMGLIAGSVGESSLGALETVLPPTLLLYPVGILLFGISILRAGILPRWAAILLIIGVVGAVLGPLLGEGVLVGRIVGRVGGVAQALGLAWLGYALWSERQEKASEPLPAMQS